MARVYSSVQLLKNIKDINKCTKIVKKVHPLCTTLNHRGMIFINNGLLMKKGQQNINLSAISCHVCLDLYEDLVDSCLTEKKAVKLESHLTSCPDCIENIAQTELLIAYAKECYQEDSPLPKGVRSRLYAHLNAELGLSMRA